MGLKGGRLGLNNRREEVSLEATEAVAVPPLRAPLGAVFDRINPARRRLVALPELMVQMERYISS
jgi:hypothetical protein